MPDSVPHAPAVPEPRKGMPSPELDRATFETRFRSRFADPAFDPLRDEIDRLAAAAWDGYIEGRKSPLTRPAGPSFAEPDYELALDWLDAHKALRAAEAQHDDAAMPARILIINASSRSEHTCPGEMSKSWRLVQIAREVVEGHAGVETEVLDLSRLASEYGREIHPCKACFSTAAALCHWPCSCYPNYSLGQVHDWMNDIYPMWVRAHGVLIVTPVNWYHASSPFKLMMDRLVCADGGNPDPPRRTARPFRWPRRWSWPTGPIPAIWRVGVSPWSFMAMQKAPRTCVALCPTGWFRWSCRRPAPRSIVTSAIGSLTPPAMTPWIAIQPFKMRCG